MLDLCMFADATYNQEEVVAVGPEGKLEALIPEMVLRIGRRGEHWIGSVEVESVHDDRIPYQGHHHGSSYLEHLDFIAACRGERPAAVDLADGLLSVAMGVAAHRSIDESRPVLMGEIL
jgi:predicted dehydrogenase